MADETGAKWWIRYVAVPLIGGGGIIGLILSQMGQHLPTSNSDTNDKSHLIQTAPIPPAAAPTTPKPDSQITNQPAVSAPTKIDCTFIGRSIKLSERQGYAIFFGPRAPVIKFFVDYGETQVERTVQLDLGVSYQLDMTSGPPLLHPDSNEPPSHGLLRTTVSLIPAPPCRYNITLSNGQVGLEKADQQ